MTRSLHILLLASCAGLLLLFVPESLRELTSGGSGVAMESSVSLRAARIHRGDLLSAFAASVGERVGSGRATVPGERLVPASLSNAVRLAATTESLELDRANPLPARKVVAASFVEGSRAKKRVAAASSADESADETAPAPRINGELQEFARAVVGIADPTSIAPE